MYIHDKWLNFLSPNHISFLWLCQGSKNEEFLLKTNTKKKTKLVHMLPTVLRNTSWICFGACQKRDQKMNKILESWIWQPRRTEMLNSEFMDTLEISHTISPAFRPSTWTSLDFVGKWVWVFRGTLKIFKHNA